jgi:hypothetical protein
MQSLGVSCRKGAVIGTIVGPLMIGMINYGLIFDGLGILPAAHRARRRCSGRATMPEL